MENVGNDVSREISGADTSFEQYKFKEELKIKQAELALKEREITKSRRLPEGLLLALIALLGTFLGAFLQGRNNIDVEQKKTQSSLIIEAIKTGNPDSAIKNLNFLVQLGLLEDKDGVITKLSKQSVPVLPAPPLQNSLSTLKTEIDILKYCQEKFGPQFFPIDAEILSCTDGNSKFGVRRSDVCLWASGTESVIMDFGSLTWNCDRTERPIKESPNGKNKS